MIGSPLLARLVSRLDSNNYWQVRRAEFALIAADHLIPVKTGGDCYFTYSKGKLAFASWELALLSPDI